MAVYLGEREKRAIGKSHLERTLKQGLGWENFGARHCWLEMDKDFILKREFKNATNLVMPDELKQFLGFPNLGWEEICGALPVLMFGLEESKIGEGGFEDSIATIEIARSSRIVKGTAEDERIPLFIRMAGIAKDKIVALNYDAQSGKLIDINVSIADEEIPDPDGFGISYYSHNKLFFVLKSNQEDAPPRNHYDTAGIITKGMEDELARRYPNRHHTKALRCRVYDRSVTFGYDPNVIYEGESPAQKAAKKLGFYARHEDGMVVIGFQKPEGEQRDMPAWELRLPHKLQQAA